MVAILCPPVPTGNNMIPSTDNRLFSTIVEYNCLLGYYVNPNTANQYNSLSIECLENEVWNFTAIPDCARESLRQDIIIVCVLVLKFVINYVEIDVTVEVNYLKEDGFV